MWEFLDFVSGRGVNEIHAWLNSKDVPHKAKAKINARVVSLRGFPIFPEAYFSSYKGWDDIYELRIVYGGVQYRPFGCYGPSRMQFSLLVGGIEKGAVPKSLLKVADERRQIILSDPARVVPHDFS